MFKHVQCETLKEYEKLIRPIRDEDLFQFESKSHFIKQIKLRDHAFSIHLIMNTIGIKDIQLIHEKTISLRGNPTFSHISHRQLYFVAACALLDPEIDGEIALKFRPYGGFIGIDNSRLDPLLKHSKVLRLHAALHDAAGFVKDCRNKGPGYVYAVRYSPLNNCLFGHLTRILFILSVKIFHPRLFRELE